MQKLDVIITSTARPVVERCLMSFLDNISYSGGFRFLANIDNVHGSVLDRTLSIFKRFAVEVVRVNDQILTSHANHARAMNTLSEELRSDYYFHLEDDWRFKRKVDLNPLVDTMIRHGIDQVRFSKETILDYDWLFHESKHDIPEYRAPRTEKLIDFIPMTRTCLWSFNPSLCKRSTIQAYFPLPVDGRNPEDYICKLVSKPESNYLGYILGGIGEAAIVEDIGRNRWQKIKEALRQYKWRYLSQQQS